MHKISFVVAKKIKFHLMITNLFQDVNSGLISFRHILLMEPVIFSVSVNKLVNYATNQI